MKTRQGAVPARPSDRAAEGEAIPLKAGALATRISGTGTGELVRGNEVISRAGGDLTLFGGAGADGALVVCGDEEFHPDS